MGDIVRADANGHDSIWLRQSVTFTVDGQTRTLEVGIPLPPGATPDDVEALLGEADSGMARLSRYLDARVAAQLGMPPLESPAILPQPTPAEQAPVPAFAPASMSEPLSALPELEEDLPAPLATNDFLVDETAAADEPTFDASTPTPPTSDAPVTPPTAPTRPRPARSEPRPAVTAPQPASQASVPAPHNPVPAAPLVTGPDMTRPQFITALGELGLNPKQAMDRLSVRSLEGLNLREALEALRRQLLQETPGSPALEPEPEPAVEARYAEPEPVVPAASPRYFDEEDDPNLVFTVDEPEFEDDEEFEAVGAAAEPLDEEDDLDLDDVPDFPAPPLSAPPTAASRMPRRVAPARTPDVDPAAKPAARTAPVQSASGPERSRAMQLIGKMRSSQGGGPASDYQRKAYHNLVEDQLGGDQAAALVRGLWRIPAERLTSDQFDALIRWGKEDAFVDEATLVLATLRAEQARAADSNGTASEQGATTAAQRPRPVRGASASPSPTRQGGAR